MADVKQIILDHASELSEEVIGLRRHFHKNPELSFHETGTAAFIENWMRENDISYRRGIAGTGIIGVLKGEKAGSKIIAVRAEMDALPITEKNTAGYASSNKGVMHACGHDAHMAMLMGTTRLLSGISHLFGGTVLLVFQPGEEKTPGGAKLMIGSGELYNPKPDIILAQHILPEMETGMAGYKPGRYMASCDEIYITVAGKGGHAALPGLTTDQIYIASRLVVMLKERMKKRQAEVGIPTVLGIGRFTGEGATNVIPEKVEIAGTFRTFDEGWRSEALSMIKNISAETAKESGVEITVRIEEGYPVLVNDDILTSRAMDLSRQILGNDMVVKMDLRMSSDDFSFYSSVAPSLYFRLGIGKKGSEPGKLHSPGFDLDENGLSKGVANLSWLIYNFLSD
jgi:amidohydrolase